MIGIQDFGSYLPYFRYERQEQGRAWDLKQAMPLLVGERTVANYDEDTATMAVEAVLNCLEGHDPAGVDALYFASTTAPFGEKSAAAIVALAADLSVPRVADFGSSLRAGTAALQAALDAVKAGSAKQVVVAAADMRQAAPGSVMESIMGDGAGALLIGQGNDVIAEVSASYHVTQHLFDTWRLQNQTYLNTDDEAYTDARGYRAMVAQALSELLKTAALKPGDLSRVVVYAPDGRNYADVAKRSPALAAFNPEPLLMGAGNLGTASAFAQLALVLETAQPGDRIALVGYGDGADAFLLTVTGAIRERRPRRGVMDWLNSKGYLPSYQMALFFRQGLPGKPLWPANLEAWTSVPLLQREQHALLNFYGVKCNHCGSVWWPQRRVCYDCGAQDDFSPVKLSHQGTIASFVAEWATPSPLSPVGMAVVDTADGARLTVPMCDVDMNKVRVGDPVEFCFRIYHMSKDIPHYAWKVRPVRDDKVTR